MLFRSVAVESGNGAVRDLQSNADRAGVRVQAFAETVDSYLEAHESSPDFVLADPPRAGLGKYVTQKLIAAKPRAITIVSCDPATAARDLAALTGAGYSIDRITLLDLFPQTFHIETVVLLSLKP